MENKPAEMVLSIGNAENQQSKNTKKIHPVKPCRATKSYKRKLIDKEDKISRGWVCRNPHSWVLYIDKAQVTAWSGKELDQAWSGKELEALTETWAFEVDSITAIWLSEHTENLSLLSLTDHIVEQRKYKQTKKLLFIAF